MSEISIIPDPIPGWKIAIKLPKIVQFEYAYGNKSPFKPHFRYVFLHFLIESVHNFGYFFSFSQFCAIMAHISADISTSQQNSTLIFFTLLYRPYVIDVTLN